MRASGRVAGLGSSRLPLLDLVCVFSSYGDGWLAWAEDIIIMMTIIIINYIHSLLHHATTIDVCVVRRGSSCMRGVMRRPSSDDHRSEGQRVPFRHQACESMVETIRRGRECWISHEATSSFRSVQIRPAAMNETVLATVYGCTLDMCVHIIPYMCCMYSTVHMWNDRLASSVHPNPDRHACRLPCQPCRP